MRGFSILLVFLLGFASCGSPIRAYYLEEDKATESATSASIEVGESVKEVPANENDGAINQQDKRELGMPAPIQESTITKLDGDQQQAENQQQNSPDFAAEMQPPINEPLNQSQDNQDPNRQQTDSSARGFGLNFAAPKTESNQQEQTQKQRVPDSNQQVPAENLPVIIEKDKPVSPQTLTNDQQQPKPQVGQSLTLPQSPQTGLTQQTSVGEPGKPISTARTFDSWTNCVGASTGKYGTCKNDVECNKSKGRADGSCMGGFGVCCVVALSCNEKSLENNTFYANPDFPEPSWEARLCEVEIKKKHKNILQVMIEFEEFELAPPNYDGECITDVFQVKLASNRPSPYSLLRICGQNTGQHMYLDVSQIDEPLILSVATSGGGFPRRWSIRIVQMDEKNFLLAPPGCLQYYTDTVGHFRSFNLGRNLRNLYYAVCFRIDNGYSGIRFTSNFFGMNGPQCKRRPPSHRHNGTVIEAHPHHLVIPPPGYAPPPPKAKLYPQQVHHLEAQPPAPYQAPLLGQQQGRYKRYAYAEAIGDRYPRTLHEHEHEHEKAFKLAEKDSKFEEKEFKHHPHEYPPSYGGYGPPHQGYGPHQPPIHQGYGYQPTEYPYYGHEGKKEEFKDFKKEKWGEKKHEYEGEFEGGKFWGWKDGKKEFKESKYESKYGPPTYGPAYGHAGHEYSTYGPSGYGGGYGGYHHKEIDKFGKKYEHLEYKHEKNHHKEDEKTAGWWSWWGKKEETKDKKKEKFLQHHEALFPMMRIPEMPHCEPRFCGQNDVITFPPSGDSIAEMCGNRFNRGRGPKIISGSPLVVYVSNRGHQRGSGFDMNYEQVFYIPKPY